MLGVTDEQYSATTADRFTENRADEPQAPLHSSCVESQLDSQPRQCQHGISLIQGDFFLATFVVDGSQLASGNSRMPSFD
jgi:hypothetical protein